MCGIERENFEFLSGLKSCNCVVDVHWAAEELEQKKWRIDFLISLQKRGLTRVTTHHKKKVVIDGSIYIFPTLMQISGKKRFLQRASTFLSPPHSDIYLCIYMYGNNYVEMEFFFLPRANFFLAAFLRLSRRNADLEKFLYLSSSLIWNGWTQT